MQAVVYSKDNCQWCDRVRQLLKSVKIDYIEYRVDENNEMFQQMLELSNGRQSVPQIFIDDKHVGGYDDLVELDMEGGLDSNE